MVFIPSVIRLHIWNGWQPCSRLIMPPSVPAACKMTQFTTRLGFVLEIVRPLLYLSPYHHPQASLVKHLLSVISHNSETL